MSLAVTKPIDPHGLARRHEGYKALCSAARQGSAGEVAKLLEFCDDSMRGHVGDLSFWTAIMWATVMGHLERVKILAPTSNLTQPLVIDSQGCPASALDLAKGNPRIHAWLVGWLDANFDRGGIEESSAPSGLQKTKIPRL